MELHEALSRIEEIRGRLAATEVFRGYRALPVALSGVVAAVAAGWQGLYLPAPAEQLPAYLTLWTGAAGLSIVLTAATVLIRDLWAGTPSTRALTRLAVAQFAPSVVAGGLLTFVIARHAPQSAWMLPGLWQILFSLGVFASCRLLPRAVFGVAVFYLFSGLAVLIVAQGEHALSPWAMGLPFGVGQFGAAAVLYWTLERNHAGPPRHNP